MLSYNCLKSWCAFMSQSGSYGASGVLQWKNIWIVQTILF